MNPLSKSSNQNIGVLIRDLLFFILFFLYICLVIETRFIYHGNGMTVRWPVFYTGWEFFQQFLSYPGGLVEYGTALLFQLFYLSWAGALILTVLAWLMCACTGAYLDAIHTKYFRWIRWIAPMLILILYTQYTYYLITIAAVAVALLFVRLYLKIAPKDTPSGIIILLILSAILYILAGGAFYAFAALCAIYEVFYLRRWRTALVCLLSVIAIPFVVGVLIYEVRIAEAFNSLLPLSWKISCTDHLPHKALVVSSIYAVCIFLPAAAAILGLFHFFASGSRSQQDAPNTSDDKPDLATSRSGAGLRAWYTGKPALKWLAESLLLFAVAGATIYFSTDSRIKASCAVDYYAFNQQWPEVLETAKDYPNNYFIIHAVDRALFHTDRLFEDMFDTPQDFDFLFLTAEGVQTHHWRRAGMYIDLGLLNLAEKSLCESLEQLGERPVILRQMALINLAKGNYDAAKVYLHRLQKTLFFSAWADDYLARLKTDPGLSNDTEITHLRQVMMDKDYIYIAYKTESVAADFERLLFDLLEKNRHNRMAFEYLMAYYLQTKQLDKFAQNLGRMNDFNYPNLPRQFEEAILISQDKLGQKIDINGRMISPESIKAFHRCTDALRRSNGELKLAYNELVHDYKNTYFFYYLFYNIDRGA
ncbi:hypothetical protein JXA32_07980 [Candidatus Sumerlaeota bacterium]|nr:hypothetical protein [Candidatus Sumerlaeota bacterium]